MAISLSSQSNSATFTGVVQAPDRAGFMVIPGQSTAPTGWLLCDGSAVSRTTYADLFTAIGTTYGVGDGSTTFNLPDLSLDIGGVTRVLMIKCYNDSGAVSISTANNSVDGTTSYAQLASSPSAPATGYLAFYAKNDGNFYKKTPAGTESQVGGSALTTSDEGTPVSTATTTLNFTGAGVTASLSSPGVVAVNIPGSTGDISNGGNSFGSAITIGTNDAFALQFETNNVQSASCSTTGAWTFGKSTGSAVTHTFQSNGATILAVDSAAGAATSTFKLTYGGTNGLTLQHTAASDRISISNAGSGEILAATTAGAWTVGPTSAIGGTGFAGTQIVARTTNTSVAAGYVGEIKKTLLTTATNTGSTGAYLFSPTVNVSLPAGIWRVKGSAFITRNGATFTSTDFIVAVSVGSPSPASSLYNNVNATSRTGDIPTSFTSLVMAVNDVVVKSDGTNLTLEANGSTLGTGGTTLYLMINVGVFSAGQPQYTGYIQATRLA